MQEISANFLTETEPLIQSRLIKHFLQAFVYVSIQQIKHNTFPSAYNTMKKIFLSGVLLFAIAQLFGQNGTIRGRVFNDKTNDPLPFTNIVIFGTNIGSISDLDGNFIYYGIHAGLIRHAATSVGFETKMSEEFQVTNGKTVFIDIPMRETSIELEQVVVRASPFRKTEESPVSMRTLGIGDIEKSPGSSRDISKVIQTLPGVATTVSFRNDLIVSGGGPA